MYAKILSLFFSQHHETFFQLVVSEMSVTLLSCLSKNNFTQIKAMDKFSFAQNKALTTVSSKIVSSH